jgi:hypothetical protein
LSGWAIGWSRSGGKAEIGPSQTTPRVDARKSARGAKIGSHGAPARMTIAARKLCRHQHLERFAASSEVASCVSFPLTLGRVSVDFCRVLFRFDHVLIAF